MPFVPFDTRRLLDDKLLVVAKPPHVMLGVVPPDEITGHVPVTAVTPLAEVVVAMI